MRVRQIKKIRSLLGLIALLQLASGFGEAGEIPDINFDTIVFLSSWTKSGNVQLVNGQYREPAAPGSATETVVKLADDIACGRVDGKDAAAVILVTNPGGSGTFYDLALLVTEPQGWVNQDIAFLGDRVKIHSFAITDNKKGKKRKKGDVRAEIALQNCSDPLSSASGPCRRLLYPSVLLGLTKHSGAK